MKPKQVLFFILVTTSLLALFGIGGTVDYNEAVVQEMGNNTYITIYNKLGGHGCKTSDIVNEYKSNQKMYDQLNK